MDKIKINYYETYKKKYPDVVKTTIGTVFPFNALQAANLAHYVADMQKTAVVGIVKTKEGVDIYTSAQLAAEQSKVDSVNFGRITDLAEYKKFYPDCEYSFISVAEIENLNWNSDEAIAEFIEKLVKMKPLYFKTAEVSGMKYIKAFFSEEFNDNVQKFVKGAKLRFFSPGRPMDTGGGILQREGVKYVGGVPCISIASLARNLRPSQDSFALYWRPVEKGGEQ